MPRSKKPTKGSQYIVSIDDHQNSFDVEAFDNALRSNGVTLVHYRAMRCPIGMTDKYDIRHPNDIEHTGCSNGYIYKKAGEITGFFQSNEEHPVHLPEGMLDSASAAFTFPRKYDDSPNPVVVVPYDRFFLKDCEANVATWETVEASQTGIDRVQYPILSVEHLVDSRGVEYEQGKDFKILNGKIQWTGSKKPGWESEIDKGTVYSVRYRYQPHWYVKKLVHEIRVAQITDPLTFKRTVERMPYQAVLQREYIFLTNQRSNDSTNERDTRSPSDGGNLGPR